MFPFYSISHLSAIADYIYICLLCAVGCHANELLSLWSDGAVWWTTGSPPQWRITFPSRAFQLHSTPGLSFSRPQAYRLSHFINWFSAAAVLIPSILPSLLRPLRSAVLCAGKLQTSLHSSLCRRLFDVLCLCNFTTLELPCFRHAPPHTHTHPIAGWLLCNINLSTALCVTALLCFASRLLCKTANASPKYSSVYQVAEAWFEGQCLSLYVSAKHWRTFIHMQSIY